MAPRLSKIVTKKGDQGKTGLGDGSRVAKDCLRVEALRTIDELNSVIALLQSVAILPIQLDTLLTQIQHDLFDIGGELSIPGYYLLTLPKLTQLEDELTKLNKKLPPLQEFILPKGSQAVALCHFARTVARRAERRVVSLAKKSVINHLVLQYLNRLSDYCLFLPEL